MIRETENPCRRVYVRVSLRGVLMLIRIDTLRSVYNVGCIAGRLNYWSECTDAQAAIDLFCSQKPTCTFFPYTGSNFVEVQKKT